MMLDQLAPVDAPYVHTDEGEDDMVRILFTALTFSERVLITIHAPSLDMSRVLSWDVL